MTRIDPHRFSIAPMLDWTDRHERYFLRLLTRHALLYTEMVTTGALLHGDRARHLDFSREEHPVALQLGGSEPDDMARCAELAQQWGYDEVNINVGCPSDRVQSGSFGACLMAEPERVAACVKSMQAACDIPVTVKSRIGIDEHDSEAFLQRFVDTVAEAGCDTFIVHARIAILAGLSPKENRDVPPLKYERVHRLKERHPELKISINGGLKTLAACQAQLDKVDGVMMGREAYQNPYILASVDQDIFGSIEAVPARQEVMKKYLAYVADQLASGTALQHMTRHILGLYKGQPGGRLFRRHLSENAHRKGASISVLEDAVALAEAAIERQQQADAENMVTPAEQSTQLQTGVQHA
ncbi:tRNA-dihydrouridine(20/20a) synthase [Pseudohongiella nitratireducens]|uniref:tRNA-dihydrouridine(20/20a) synthase n=1 Tax=Pseudohongiella nitratireducens TaxID=1768907 RepID=A0A916QPB9_9GAMM|nr:tRNA dihydrouridine(20/20a) synthase DusA [Pseudohongiella nitratireducens]GFZ83708.1 tRNA-dihydrouridine(20/20a) synthase [Pseudohongiella nitratireducens]